MEVVFEANLVKSTAGAQQYEEVEVDGQHHVGRLYIRKTSPVGKGAKRIKVTIETIDDDAS